MSSEMPSKLIPDYPFQRYIVLLITSQDRGISQFIMHIIRYEFMVLIRKPGIVYYS